MQINTYYFLLLFMIRDLTAFYVAIKDNEVVKFGTNLTAFHNGFKELEPGVKNYEWFYRQFKKEKYFKIVIGSSEYFIQKVI